MVNLYYCLYLGIVFLFVNHVTITRVNEPFVHVCKLDHVIVFFTCWWSVHF